MLSGVQEDLLNKFLNEIGYNLTVISFFCSFFVVFFCSLFCNFYFLVHFVKICYNSMPNT